MYVLDSIVNLSALRATGWRMPHISVSFVLNNAIAGPVKNEVVDGICK
jgi:hypothetical protein